MERILFSQLGSTGPPLLTYPNVETRELDLRRRFRLLRGLIPASARVLPKSRFIFLATFAEDDSFLVGGALIEDCDANAKVGILAVFQMLFDISGTSRKLLLSIFLLLQYFFKWFHDVATALNRAVLRELHVRDLLCMYLHAVSCFHYHNVMKNSMVMFGRTLRVFHIRAAALLIGFEQLCAMYTYLSLSTHEFR